jgi:hypothetical protein
LESNVSFLDLPDKIDGEPPPQHRDCFERIRFDSARYVLKPEAKAHIARCEAMLAAAEGKAKAELQAERAAHAETRNRLIALALDDALTASGVPPQVRQRAVAHLRRIWQFSVSDRDGGHVVAVKNGDAEHDLNQAVDYWLASDAGLAFSTRRPATPDALSSIKQITR